jgi:hypothetical protein
LETACFFARVDHVNVPGTDDEYCWLGIPGIPLAETSKEKANEGGSATIANMIREFK